MSPDMATRIMAAIDHDAFCRFAHRTRPALSHLLEGTTRYLFLDDLTSGRASRQDQGEGTV